MRFLKSEPCALVIIFTLFTVFLFHFGFSFYFSNAYFENTSLGQLYFPEREQEKTSLAVSGKKKKKAGIIMPWELWVAVRASHSGSKNSTREGQNLRDLRERRRISPFWEEYFFPPKGGIQPLEGFMFSMHSRGQLLATVICAPSESPGQKVGGVEN